MGSVGNQNPWAPYNTDSKDCSQSICSINCPHYCYFFFPPPPESDDDSTGPLSPLLIAVIGVLAAAFLLVAYYAVVTRYCKRRPAPPFAGGEHENIDRRHELIIRCRVGLDESLIGAIGVREYRAGDGLTEVTECSVCLTDFVEKEPVRILPECGHAFHVPCIDTWLRSHSSCPLCRAGVVASVSLDVESQRDDADFISAVDGGGGGGDDNDDNGEGVVGRFRRSVSLEGEKDRFRRGIGSSRSRVGLRRSVSTGEL